MRKNLVVFQILFGLILTLSACASSDQVDPQPTYTAAPAATIPPTTAPAQPDPTDTQARFNPAGEVT
jgi:hypothetical protein